MLPTRCQLVAPMLFRSANPVSRHSVGPLLSRGGKGTLSSRQRSQSSCPWVSRSPLPRSIVLNPVCAQQPFGVATTSPPPPPPPAGQAAGDLLEGTGRLLQGGSQRLQDAVSGIQLSTNEAQLPFVSGVQPPVDIDAQEAATTAAQAIGTAAEAVGQAVQAALLPLDVFGGAWLLNLLFWGILGTLSYSVIVLAPRQ